MGYSNEREAALRLKSHEIERLEYMNRYLEMGIKKREEIIKNYFEEICSLKDELKMANKVIERLRVDSKKSQNKSSSLSNSASKLHCHAHSAHV